MNSLGGSLTILKRIICLFLFVASTMQATAGAMVPLTNVMTSHAMEQTVMTAAQQAHCREMMENGSMSMDMMMECANDCECCSGVCSTTVVFIEYQHQSFSDITSISTVNLPVSFPVSISASLYRPPINV